MGIGLEARFAAVAGVDEVHRFALACGREELSVAGGGKAQAPVAGHGQLRLRLDHHGRARSIASLSICQRERRESWKKSWVLRPRPSC